MIFIFFSCSKSHLQYKVKWRYTLWRMLNIHFLDMIGFQLSAGESTPLKLQAIDELGNEVVTTVLAVADPEKAFLQSNFLFLSPNKTSAFMFMQPKESYEKTKENNLHHTFWLLLTDIWSFFANGYYIKIETEVCHPGFVYSKHTQTCVCDESEKAIKRWIIFYVFLRLKLLNRLGTYFDTLRRMSPITPPPSLLKTSDICLPNYLSIYLSIYHLSIYVSSICLPVCLSVCLSISFKINAWPLT